MTIAEKKVVSIHYTLKNDDGEIVDSSEGHPPLEYLHGAANIVIGLEKALLGKSVGDKLQVVVEPEEGYGEFRPELVQQIPASSFGGVDELAVGMAFHAESSDGTPQIVEIIEIDGDDVTINGNPPLAGQRLHFEVEVTDIRDATEEEIDHGHAHGVGGEQHD
ncbi:FKBP-type peptidyl-prolyl cis-trans isomerase [Marinibactrum halimedae]|uniref:Peptidyl-prolyl cis-trans isomerase n=1 Tax=Marinibactrum halimedae TaxID=1444977 RepID=A0AA37TA24_9GAMM|nr:peptidylprolyl isomerase [Marinibactrum halimedae]MCD9457480.1 peptidylprolyl isomerase [Marinibactrum halimedae]GLS25467.1 peptidyl-prolyl cis-trans isomerase [Marinibactrum halimedae]